MVPHILLVPGVVAQITDIKKKKMITAAVVLIGILYFIFFLKTAPQDGIRVLPYKTWIMEGIKDYPYANEVL
jgi:hypothetical protein